MSRPSLRAAINAMCKSCLYDPGNGNGGWREQIQGCPSSNCSLHPVRPMPVNARKSRQDAREAAWAAMPANQNHEALAGPKGGLYALTTAQRRVA